MTSGNLDLWDTVITKKIYALPGMIDVCAKMKVIGRMV